MVSNSLRKSSNISVSLYWLGYSMKIQSKLLAECKIRRHGRSIFFWFILETSIRERFGCWKSLQRSLMSHLLKVSKWIFSFMQKCNHDFFCKTGSGWAEIVYCYQSSHENILYASNINSELNFSIFKLTHLLPYWFDGCKLIHFL